MLELARVLSSKKKKRHKHELSEVRADFLDRRWTPLPGARSAPGAAPEAPPGEPGADPRNPRGPLTVYVYVDFSSKESRAREAHDILKEQEWKAEVLRLREQLVVVMGRAEERRAMEEKTQEEEWLKEKEKKTQEEKEKLKEKIKDMKD